MSKLQRKPRPLARNESTFRDDRLFLIATDDKYAPRQYFDFFEITRVKVIVIEKENEENGSHAQQVVNRIKSYSEKSLEEYDERWIILDTDHCIRSNHIESYLLAIKEAKESGVNVVINRSCFEVWLLLHHASIDEVSQLDHAKKVEDVLREKIGEYDKTNLKPEHYPLSSVIEACLKAEQLDSKVGGGEIPSSTTSRVYLLWKAIAAKALRSQLPKELWPLIQSS